MSEEPVLGEDQAGNKSIVDVLADGARLIEGVVAAAFVPRTSVNSPVLWADLLHADVASGLSTLATGRLAEGGPWGEVTSSGWIGWLQPIIDPSTEGEAEPAGVLALALRERASLRDREIETVKLFAQLCATTALSGTSTTSITKLLRLHEFVSTISERLMSATSSDLETVLNWTVERLCGFLRANVAFIRRNDHVNDVSVLMAFYPPRDMPIEEDPLGIVPFDSDAVFAASKDLKVPLVMRAADADDRYLERVKDAGWSAEFTGTGVPLIHGDTTEGFLGIIYLSDYQWSEPEVNALRAIAALLVQLLHRVDAEERLRRSALTDDLTGLPNRRALLEEVAARELAHKSPLALLFIDLDRFKIMNDQLGHSAGDHVLRVIADRIRTSLRPSDFAARLGGDEFVVVLESAEGELGAVAAANRLLDLIALPIDVHGQRVAHTASVGIAVTQDANLTAEELLGQADIALYAAKSQGRNHPVVFDHELEASVQQHSAIELLLRQALDEDSLGVRYQPEFDLRTGRLLAVEALVRWFRAGEGVVEAAQFVPIAEETHLIVDIDRWVLKEACKQLAAWRRVHDRSDLVVRVNMSPAQLGLAGLVRSITQCLRTYALPPETLCLEITEQAVIADVEQAGRVLEDIRSLGVKLAIDDFGTGFSSLRQLKTLPVDVLKIDRAFVDGIASDQTDQAIVEAIVRLARAFALDVVGEGIENTEDLSTLVRLGCRRGQGFLLARPLPAEEIDAIIVRGGIDLASLVGSNGAASRALLEGSNGAAARAR